MTDKEKLERIKELIAIQKEALIDDYMKGVYNGLEMARAIIEDSKPEFYVDGGIKKVSLRLLND